MSFTNTSPLTYPTRSNERTFGTNPLTLAAPGIGNDSFVLDMATSTVAFGKVELNDRKNMPIPESWGKFLAKLNLNCNNALYFKFYKIQLRLYDIVTPSIVKVLILL